MEVIVTIVSKLVGWFHLLTGTYPTYLYRGETIHLLSTMDIPVCFGLSLETQDSRIPNESFGWDTTKHVPGDPHKTRKGTQPKRCLLLGSGLTPPPSVFFNRISFLKSPEQCPPHTNNPPFFEQMVQPSENPGTIPPHTIFSKAPKLVLTWYVWTVSPSTPSARQ